MCNADGSRHGRMTINKLYAAVLRFFAEQRNFKLSGL
jgi:hypothetical protein